VEAFTGLDLKVRRGDEVSVAQDILGHIVKQIIAARLVIANISSRNPNVMYELGIAHALGKTVIMVSSSEDKLPFDMRNRRVVLYSSREDLIRKLRDEVARKLLTEPLAE
jgi:nucleoside 2-deoxyribosyltransferase